MPLTAARALPNEVLIAQGTVENPCGALEQFAANQASLAPAGELASQDLPGLGIR